MRMPYSKIKYFKKTLNVNTSLLLKENTENSYIENKIHNVVYGNVEFVDKYIIKNKNFFASYDKHTYGLYKEIAKVIPDLCNLYETNSDNNEYMLYGKINEYLIESNNTWYDYPGINIPCMYGLYNTSNKEIVLEIKNNDLFETVILNPGDIFINKPTDLMKVCVKENSFLLDLYLSPRFMLINNEPGVWLPI